MNNKSNNLYFERQDRKLILFALGCLASMGSVLIYINLITEEFWNSSPQFASSIPVILLVGGFFTSVYFYRRTLPEC